MQSQPTTIPYGFCHCGCGQRTKIAPQSDPRCGDVCGEPRRYLHYHHLRKHDQFAITDRETGCWVWQGHLSQGYARVTIDGRRQLLYRVIYEAIHGPIPSGLQLDHLCRNRACINPAHLEAVPPAINIRRGKNAKLTELQVAEIRELAGTLSQSKLGMLYGVSQGVISKIILGKAWRI